MIFVLYIHYPSHLVAHVINSWFILILHAIFEQLCTYDLYDGSITYFIYESVPAIRCCMSRFNCLCGSHLTERGLVIRDITQVSWFEIWSTRKNTNKRVCVFSLGGRGGGGFKSRVFPTQEVLCCKQKGITNFGLSFVYWNIPCFFWGESINSDLPDRLITKSQVGGFFLFQNRGARLESSKHGWFHQVFLGGEKHKLHSGNLT